MPRRTVLIVEDDVDCREATHEILESEGFAAVSVNDGAEALAYLRNAEPPGLILLDLMLPVMDGWQFLEARKAEPRLREIPVVIVSGERDLGRKASALGVEGALLKPIELDVLLETVRRFTE